MATPEPGDAVYVARMVMGTGEVEITSCLVERVEATGGVVISAPPGAVGSGRVFPPPDWRYRGCGVWEPARQWPDTWVMSTDRAVVAEEVTGRLMRALRGRGDG